MISKKYSAFPAIDFRTVWKSTKENNPILDQANCYLYASGRSALFHGMLCFPATKRNKILVPFYHCGVEVEAILRAGFEVAFYKLKDNLEIDLAWMEDNLTADVVAVLVVHFFGFPQPLEEIRSFCQQKNLYLIEDCAHALYSGIGKIPSGSLGDMAIFSIMKTVGLPNGGALLVNNEQFSAPKKGRRYFNMALLKKIIRSSFEFEANRNQRNNGWATKILQYHDNKQVSSTTDNNQGLRDKRWYYEVSQYYYYHAISRISMWFLKPMSVSKIIKKRRRNYAELVKQISWNKGMSPLFEKCDEGICPLCLPVRVHNSDSWSKKLIGKGIFPFVFGRFAHPSFQYSLFPQVIKFQRGIVGLPVHQQLTDDDLKAIACRVNTLLRGKE